MNRPKPPGPGRASRAKVVTVRHGGKSALRAAQLDKRSVEYRYVREHAAELMQHLGGLEALSVPQREVVTRAAEARLLTSLAWGAVLREGVLDKSGRLTGAMTAYLTVAARHVELLRVLGLERRARQVPDLRAYLEAVDHGSQAVLAPCNEGAA